MPFVDLNRQSPASFQADPAEIVIIGSGAAGILLAVSLTRAGKKVLVLESGHFGEDADKQQLNEVQQSGKVLENAVVGRKRAIGGTTIAWGGQSLMFGSLDFMQRDWVQNSGWPLSQEDLLDYYKEANAFMGVDRLDYKNDIFPGIRLQEPAVDPALLDYHVSKWAVTPDFYLLYKGYLEKNITILYNAHLQEITRTQSGAVGSIRFVNFMGDSFSYDCKKLILAAGGLESVRILLNNGMGNHAGLLGKFFMDHPCIEVGELETDDPYRLQRFFNTHRWEGRKYSIRLSLAASLQRERKLLNCSAGILFLPQADAFDPYGELRSFKKDFKLSRLLKVSGSAGSIGKSIWAYWKDKFYYKVNATGKLVLMAEQEPVGESYLALSAEKDRFGAPKALIHWHITNKTWDTVVEMSRILKQEIERLAFGKVSLYPAIVPENENWGDLLSDVNHHMGGARMSAAAAQGVVDTNLQVWDTPNLYVCSSAIFPTSSHSNPTLTLLALGLRLSDYIKNK